MPATIWRPNSSSCKQQDVSPGRGMNSLIMMLTIQTIEKDSIRMLIACTTRT